MKTSTDMFYARMESAIKSERFAKSEPAFSETEKDLIHALQRIAEIAHVDGLESLLALSGMKDMPSEEIERMESVVRGIFITIGDCAKSTIAKAKGMS